MTKLLRHGISGNFNGLENQYQQHFFPTPSPPLLPIINVSLPPKIIISEIISLINCQSFQTTFSNGRWEEKHFCDFAGV